MSKTFNKTNATAFAPATVGNLAVGFDLLGFALHKVGDTITVSTKPLLKKDYSQAQQVIIEKIEGDDTLSFQANKNTASMATLSMLESLKISQPIYLSIKKGIPGGSGLGSSAASAVAAVVALNGLLTTPMSKQALFEYALEGERIVSNSLHGDNIGPSLCGGITLTSLHEKKRIFNLPCPQDLHYLILARKNKLTTVQARNILQKTIPLTLHVHQSGYLAQFLLALHQSNYSLMEDSLKDLTVEPQRAKLIPQFSEIKQLMLDQGALGCSISGAGPAIFALFHKDEKITPAEKNLTQLCKQNNIQVTTYSNPVNAPGAYLIKST